MLFITAPSKTQEMAGEKVSSHTVPWFLDSSAELITLLKEKRPDELSTLMKMSDKLSESTYTRIQNFPDTFDLDTCRQALFTFKGDNYAALRPDEYSDAELSYAQDHLLILSGLYGMLRPLDLMYPYRLEMGLKLENALGKNLYNFWGNRLTVKINELCETKGFTTLINLASTEYSRAVVKKALKVRFLTITFREKKGSGYKTVPIYSKRARGMMIDYAISNTISDIEQLKMFDREDYRYSEALSTDKEWIFSRG